MWNRHKRHPGDSGGQGDKGSHHREQARQEHRDRTIFSKKVGGAVQIVPAEKNIPAVALHQRPAAMRPNPVRQGRTQVAADGAGRGHPQKLESAGVHQVAGERHDDFRGQRNAGRLNAHQQSNSQITRGRNDGNDEVGKNAYDFLCHPQAV